MVASVISGSEVSNPSENHGGAALPTVMAKVVNGHRSETTRLFFDPGAQVSLITKKLVAKLKLKATKKVSMMLGGAISQVPPKSYDVVDVTVKLGGHRRDITASVVETLPRAITARGLAAAAKRLKDLDVKLADQGITTDTVRNVGILVGANHIDDFLSTRRTFKEGIGLYRSPVGYIIGGRIPPEFPATPDRGEAVPMIAGGVVIMNTSIHYEPPGKLNQVGSDEHSATLGKHFYRVHKEGDRLPLNLGNLVTVGGKATKACGPLGGKVRSHSVKARHTKDVKVKGKGAKTTGTNKFTPPEVHAGETGRLKLDRSLLDESGRMALVSRVRHGGSRKMNLI
nr:uncharacterized protein LOC128696681 [Cherax quadricarinatus]